MDNVLDLTSRELLEIFLKDGMVKRELIVWLDEIDVPEDQVLVVEIHTRAKNRSE